MEDETINAKLGHLGGTIDSVKRGVERVETALEKTDARLEKVEGDVVALRGEGAARSAQISAISENFTEQKKKLRDVEMLVWKVVAAILFLHAGSEEILKLFR